MKLEIDGSVLPNGASGCGGVLKSPQGNWMGGFSCKLTTVLPTIAELIGINNGLQLCWNRGYSNIVVMTDCTKTLCMTRSIHIYRPIVQDSRVLLHREWQVVYLDIFIGRRTP